MANNNSIEETHRSICLETFPARLPGELLEETIMESSHGYVIVSIQEGGDSIVFVNNAFEEITGYRASEVFGLSCGFLLNGDIDQESLVKLQGAIHSKQRSTQIVRNYRKDGSLFYNELTVYPISGQSREITHLVWILRDVTAILETKERSSTYTQHSNEALWRLDFHPPIPMNLPESEQVQAILERGVFGEANDVAAKLYGHKEGSEVRGRPLHNYLLGSDQGNIEMVTRLVQSKFHMERMIVTEQTTDGNQIITLNNIVPTIADDSLTHLWGTSLDVTELFNTKVELQQSKEELAAQKQSLEEKNIALKELISHIEYEKKDVLNRVVSYISEVALPSLERIRLNKGKKIYIDLHRKVLEDLASSHNHKLNEIRSVLTQREMEVCNLVKNGHSNKEIAKLLNIAKQTVEKHRRMARKKLGLNNTKVNLYSYLNSLQEQGTLPNR